MATFSYTPENADRSAPARLELVSRDEADLRATKQTLIRSVLDVFSDSYKEVPSADLMESFRKVNSTVEAIDQADPAQLPISVFAPLLVRCDYIPTVDSRTGLVVSPEAGQGFETVQIDVEVAAKAGFIGGDVEVHRQIIRGGFNAVAYTIEPDRPQYGDTFSEHRSLGYLNENSDYQAVMTVLDEGHPIRQLAAQLVEQAVT